MPLNDKHYAYWKEIARHDIDSALLIKEHNGHPDVIVYHLHQAIEKLLKGILILHKESPPFIHDLDRLCAKVAKHDDRISVCIEPVAILQAYYVRLRYPMGEIVDHADMLRAWQAYERIRQVVDLCSAGADTIQQ